MKLKSYKNIQPVFATKRQIEAVSAEDDEGNAILFGDLAEVYLKQDVDYILAEKDKEIARLTKELWLAFSAVHKAKAEGKRFILDILPGWEGTPSGLKTHKQIVKYEGYERKCRAMAERYGEGK